MSRSKILVVDDDAVMLSMLRRVLKLLPYEIVCCENAKEALTILEAAPTDFALIFSDMMMPELSGRDFLATLKADARLHHIPLVMLTSTDELHVVAAVIEEGAVDYLTKPFSAEQLLTLTQQLISNQP